MGDPQSTAVAHEAVGDAAPYLNEWENGSFGPSVLPGAAGLEHWDEVPYIDLKDAWRNDFDGGCWYVYSNVTLCKAVEDWWFWSETNTGPACTMVSAQEAGLAMEEVCEEAIDHGTAPLMDSASQACRHAGAYLL